MTAREIWPARRPIAIAHRAANDLSAIHAAEAAGADLLEADVWMYRGALEVRHLKTVRGLPVLWDRWRLSTGLAPRLSLDAMLAEIRSSTGIMLDLKGNDRALAAAVIAAIERSAVGRPVVVCSQNWRMLESFAGHRSIAVVHSIGGRRRLRRMLKDDAPRAIEAISMHRRFLSPATAAALHRVAPILLTWPINDERRLQEVLGCGVDGVISDRLEVLSEILRDRDALGEAVQR